jgi:hypothetical protein
LDADGCIAADEEIANFDLSGGFSFYHD